MQTTRIKTITDQPIQQFAIMYQLAAVQVDNWNTISVSLPLAVSNAWDQEERQRSYVTIYDFIFKIKCLFTLAIYNYQASAKVDSMTHVQPPLILTSCFQLAAITSVQVCSVIALLFASLVVDLLKH